jgi:hypothetical protein
MAKIIIDFPDELPPNLAMDMVRFHVREGKVSVSAGVAHYCWMTAFNSPILKDWGVFTRRKKVGQTSDSFVILKVNR